MARKPGEVSVYGQREEKPCSIIYAMKASTLLHQCIRYWCYAMDIHEKEETAEDILVVCEFKDVLFKELLRLPPLKRY